MKKQIHKNDPFKNLVLDSEEQALEVAFERGEYQEVPNFENTKEMLQEAASRYLELNTSKPVTIRINQLDLIKVKAKAKHKNIPYQTLLGSVIHHYAENREKINL